MWNECEAFLAQLWYMIDGECSGEMCETLLRHADGCTRCSDQFRACARLKALIATRCGGETAPPRVRRWRPE